MMSSSAGGEDALLSELCTICHINEPKYRCPRCSVRTCSLPCTRRHKLWSQCSGVRDPAAYLKRNELATPSAFDRDFNFITGIERGLERAERNVEHRGIPVLTEEELILNADGERVGAGKKRKRETLVKGEAGFLRGAEAGGVRVVRAPRGMSRSKENTSRWHPKHKCLSWTVEWITSDGQKTRRNFLETSTIAKTYDQIYPPPKEEKQTRNATTDNKGQGDSAQSTDAVPSATVATDIGKQSQQAQGDALERPSEQQTGQKIDHNSNELNASAPTPADAGTSQTPTAEISQAEAGPQNQLQPSLPPAGYRDVYFYLHRPRTATKQTILIPLHPSNTFNTSLRDRLILEFPTIYVLPQSPGDLSQLGKEKEEEITKCQFLLEEDYLRIYGPPPEEGSKSSEGDSEEEGTVNESAMTGLPDVDENKVLEVLQQDLSQA